MKIKQDGGDHSPFMKDWARTGYVSMKHFPHYELEDAEAPDNFVKAIYKAKMFPFSQETIDIPVFKLKNQIYPSTSGMYGGINISLSGYHHKSFRSTGVRNIHRLIIELQTTRQEGFQILTCAP